MSIMSIILDVKDVSKNFGKLEAVKNVNFQVYENEIYGIAGPNGAGKSTLFNLITGIPYHPDSGTIKSYGKHLEKMPPHKISHLGIVRTFQKPITLPDETVITNVMLGSYYGAKSKSDIFDQTRNVREKSLRILDYVGLFKKEKAKAGGLTTFEKKKLMLASALAMNPKLILLDEPLAGLSPQEIQEATSLIRKLNLEKKIAIVIIEHNMRCLMDLSERVMVLHHGEKIAEGKPKEVAEDKTVVEVYVGTISL